MKIKKILKHILKLSEEDFNELATNLAKHKILLNDGINMGPSDEPCDTHFQPINSILEFQLLYVKFPDNKKLNSVKFLRDFFQIGLKEAKDMLESVENRTILLKQCSEFGFEFELENLKQKLSEYFEKSDFEIISKSF